MAANSFVDMFLGVWVCVCVWSLDLKLKVAAGRQVSVCVCFLFTIFSFVQVNFESKNLRVHSSHKRHERINERLRRKEARSKKESLPA